MRTLTELDELLKRLASSPFIGAGTAFEIEKARTFLATISGKTHAYATVDAIEAELRK